MQEPSNYVFGLQIEDPERFTEIYGDAVSSLAWDDIVHGYKNIAGKILKRYRILSAVSVPFFGRCFLVFGLSRQPFPVDGAEQVATLKTAAVKLIREMVIDNLGEATGSRLKFKVVVAPVRMAHNDVRGINRKLDKLFDSLPPGPEPVSAAARRQLFEIIEKKEVETFIQPIVALPAEKIVGYEALSRGGRSSLLQKAESLFNAAQYFGLTEELELVCIEKSMDWITKVPPGLWMSVNVGPSLLKSPSFERLVFQDRLKPIWPRLIFELTEHIPVDSVAELHETIRQLRNRGICLSLDDIGCGFFDWNTVEKFKPKIVKLCITVIRRIDRGQRILKEFNRAVSKISKHTQFVLGEGVERKAQVDLLNKCGVSMAQGNYFEKPRPAKSVL